MSIFHPLQIFSPSARQNDIRLCTWSIHPSLPKAKPFRAQSPRGMRIAKWGAWKIYAALSVSLPQPPRSKFLSFTKYEELNVLGMWCICKRWKRRGGEGPGGTTSPPLGRDLLPPPLEGPPPRRSGDLGGQSEAGRRVPKRRGGGGRPAGEVEGANWEKRGEEVVRKC